MCTVGAITSASSQVVCVKLDFSIRPSIDQLQTKHNLYIHTPGEIQSARKQVKDFTILVLSLDSARP
jgi:hypothetical protein